MYKTVDISVENYRLLIYNNVATCLYLPLIILLLNFTGNLYSFGKKRTYIELILAVAEILKYVRFQRTLKIAKKKFTIRNLLKSMITCGVSIIIFHVAAILFGAPFLSEQYETLCFATLMMVLTILPVCLYLDSDIYTLFSSLLDFDGNKLQEYFLTNIRFTMFGAWLGAVVIPLDWNKPYQDWPIPCCYGAMLGCFVGNLFLILQFIKYGNFTNKKGRFGL
ncbi:uncharacterized protein LOC130898720 isoform X1 [Diorhabda carinulata]|uniref:uncharacterized protein LOC130898720 isoform X1 n=1 Tax=Diorhabda carinulata TaxID=1163345 RepID=UPI0025A1302F|nr:uncharacterized protein LOC130898720 isoform X1 [Diorhabda carinulata]